MSGVAPPPVLEARGIVHAYAGKPALEGVDLTLRAGEVHALMGQNGAGKSTLIKVLTGVEPLQSGSILLGGQSIRPTSTLDAQQLGISTVYQEVNLCPNLSVAENIFEGRQPRKHWTRGGGLDWGQLNSRARELRRLVVVRLEDVSFIGKRFAIRGTMNQADQLPASREDGRQRRVLQRDAITLLLDRHPVARGNRSAGPV